MRDTNYKVGDWVFCEFKLQQIRSINETFVSVTDGTFEMSMSRRNFDSNAFPLEMRIKRISDSFLSQSKRVHSSIDTVGLNYPAMNGWMVSKWADVCRCEEDVRVSREIQEMETFCNEAIKTVNEVRDMQFYGFKLFRS